MAPLWRRPLRTHVLPCLQAGGLGLWLCRLTAESSTVGWRLAWLLPAIGLGLALGAGVTLLLRRRLPHRWPLYLLWGYVLCPVAAPALGLWLGCGSLLLLVLLHGHQAMIGRWLPAAVGLSALGLYLATLAPDLLPADAGEFQFIGRVLGIAHPPGYALYTVLNKLATLLPLGSVAWRANLFGALCGAATLVVLAGGLQRETGSTGAALLAVLFLGLSPTYWVQSTTANIRTLTTLLAAGTVVLLWRWARDRSPRTLTLAALAFGLGVGHHPSLAVLAPPAAAFVLVTDPSLLRQPRRWLAPLAALLASFAVWLYLPVRSAMRPAFDPDPIRTWDAFWGHVLATGFGGDMLYFRTWTQLLGRLGIWWDILRLQFGPALPAMALASALPLLRRERRSLLLLGGLWALNTLLAVTYRAPQTVEYLLPSYLALAALLGLGTAAVTKRLDTSALGALLIALLLVLTLQNGLRSLPSMQELHRDRSTRRQSETLLQAAPAQALLLANWHQATVLWYLQLVDGLRPDVQVTYVYPEGAAANEAVWLRRIDEAIAQRPVLVTNRYYGFAYRDYTWEPFHGAWRVQPTAPTGPPPKMISQPSMLGQQVELLGYTLERDQLTPGDTVALTVYWRPLVALTYDYATFAQLLGPQGVVGQGDIAQPTRNYAPGELRADAYRFPLLLQTPPGRYRLITGLYRTTDAGWERLTTARGDDHVALAEVTVSAGRQAPATVHPVRQAFEGGLMLMGYDVDRTVAGQTRLYLHWRRVQSAAPLAPWRARASEPLTVRLLDDRAAVAGTAVAEAAVPALESGQAATVVLDLPGAPGRLGVQLWRADGSALPRLGAWHRRQSTVWPLTLPDGPASYVPLGGQMVYLGLDHRPGRLAAGGSTVIAPRWLALHPLTRDDAVSLGIVGQGATWEAKADGTPALGAIPTLKWLRGWRVRDPHTLTVPADAGAGPAVLTVSVYDAFTLEPLHVLDERLVRQGQGITLQLADVTIN